MELRHHALGQLPHSGISLDRRPGQESLGFGAIESRVHAAGIVEQLRDANPAWQHGNVGDVGDVAHQLCARGPRIAPEDCELTLILSEAENRVERGGFTGAVRTDQPDDASFLDAQIDAVQGHRRPERFSNPSRLDDRHQLFSTDRLRSSFAVSPSR